MPNILSAVLSVILWQNVSYFAFYGNYYSGYKNIYYVSIKGLQLFYDDIKVMILLPLWSQGFHCMLQMFNNLYVWN